jgi:hypothetical protein
MQRTILFFQMNIAAKSAFASHSGLLVEWSSQGRDLPLYYATIPLPRLSIAAKAQNTSPDFLR